MPGDWIGCSKALQHIRLGTHWAINTVMRLRQAFKAIIFYPIKFVKCSCSRRGYWKLLQKFQLSEFWNNIIFPFQLRTRLKIALWVPWTLQLHLPATLIYKITKFSCFGFDILFIKSFGSEQSSRSFLQLSCRAEESCQQVFKKTGIYEIQHLICLTWFYNST